MTRSLRPRDANGRAISSASISNASSSSNEDASGTTAAAVRSSISSRSSGRRRNGRWDRTYFCKSFHVRPDPKLLPPEKMSVRHFHWPRVEQIHYGLPSAVAQVLTIPELMDAVGQFLADSITQKKACVARLTLAAMVRTCQAWYAQFMPFLYRHYKFSRGGENVSVAAGLERYGHLIECFTVTSTSDKMTLIILARIHAACVVHEHLAGKLSWPGLVVDDEEKKEEDEAANTATNASALDEQPCQMEESKPETEGGQPKAEEGESKTEETKLIVRTKSDVEKMTPEQLLVYVEEHPLEGIKIGRLQHLDFRGLSMDRRHLESGKLGVVIRSFPIRSITTLQFGNCTWLPDETTVLGWWPQTFPDTLETIVLKHPTNESALSLFKAIVHCPSLSSIIFINEGRSHCNRNLNTQQQFEAVLESSKIHQEDPHWRHQKLERLTMQFKFLMTTGSWRVTTTARHDGIDGLRVSLGVYYFFQRVGSSLQHLHLEDIGNAGQSYNMHADPNVRADDWIYIARQLPRLKTLNLSVSFIRQRGGLWAKAVEAFRKHCPQLQRMYFSMQPGLQKPPGEPNSPSQDLSTYETALLDDDLHAFAGSVEDDDSGTAGTSTGENGKDHEVQKLNAEADKDKILVTTAAAAKLSRPQPARVIGWHSVLQRLKLRGCQFIKAEGLLAVLERCDRLEALDARETRVATMDLFIPCSTRWACTDSLVALALDFGLYAEGSPTASLPRVQQRLAEIDAWHNGPYPSKFSTLELLYIRQRLFTLHNLKILHLGGPSMGFKIIARLSDLKSSSFVGGSEDPTIQQVIRELETRGGREVDSLLEYMSYFQVDVSLSHVANNRYKHGLFLDCWARKLKGSHTIGSLDYKESTPIFTILRHFNLPQAPEGLDSYGERSKDVYFRELVTFVCA